MVFKSKLAIPLLATLLLSPSAFAQASTCYGTVDKGRIENAVQLPAQGENFKAYSQLGISLGRTYVHSQVAQLVTAAYQSLATTMPNKVFVYGETGWKNGGRIRPHRTHQNGLSIDFLVPVVDAHAKSVYLPTTASNKFGYGINFDQHARYGAYQIDFDALAEHLYQLYQAAQTQKVTMTLVILDPPYLKKLFATKRGAFLKQHVPFMKGKAWIRHDEHYHVNFGLACKPL